MRVAEPLAASWKAELSLGFERMDGRTVLARRRHDGPLVVQKALYPEGGDVCHAIVVHPPAGVAGGDELVLDVQTGKAAFAQLTTPGAGKWYRSAGPWASQKLAFDVEGALEWLPLETIVYDGALADLSTEVRLAGDARYLGWEILCLGRTGAGERFTRGTSA
jgi:urease accessory protein